MNDAEGSVNIIDPSGNTYFMDGKGNITVTAPRNMTFNAGENLDINVGQNMTTHVGMSKSDTVTMNHIQSVGAMKMTSVMGDSSMFITGKLTEMIEGDVYSEVKQGKTVVNSDKGIETSSNGSINKHAQKEVQNNSGERSKNY